MQLSYHTSDVCADTDIDLVAVVPPRLGSNWLSGLLTFPRSTDIADCSAIHTQLDAILAAISARKTTLTKTSLVTVTAVNTAIETVTNTQILTVECG
jgi:deoxycytidylate deaminase